MKTWLASVFAAVALVVGFAGGWWWLAPSPRPPSPAERFAADCAAERLAFEDATADVRDRSLVLACVARSEKRLETIATDGLPPEALAAWHDYLAAVRAAIAPAPDRSGQALASAVALLFGNPAPAGNLAGEAAKPSPNHAESIRRARARLAVEMRKLGVDFRPPL